MFKILVFLSLFQPSALRLATTFDQLHTTCPGISNLQKTGQTSTSCTFSWNSAFSGAQYRVWYYRQEDGYTSDFSYTYSNGYTFSGLSAGHYTLFFQVMCENESGNFTGAEDIIGM